MMKNRNNFLLSSLLLILATIAVALFYFKNLPTSKTKKLSFEYCDKKVDKGYHDICLMELALQKRSSEPLLFRQAKLEVKESGLKLFLDRLVYRPHIFQFFKRSLEKKLETTSDLSECSVFFDKSDIFFLRCIELEALQALESGVSEAKKKCLIISEATMFSECSYLYLNKFIMQQAELTSAMAKSIEGHCEEIIDISWKSECYFTLSDKLSEELPPSLDLILHYCDKSNSVYNFHCFNHILFILPEAFHRQYCHKLEEGIDRIEKDQLSSANATEGDVCFGELGGLYNRAIFKKKIKQEHVKEGVSKLDYINVHKNCENVSAESKVSRERQQNIYNICIKRSVLWPTSLLNNNGLELLKSCLAAEVIPKEVCFYTSFRNQAESDYINDLKMRDSILNRVKICETFASSKKEQGECLNYLIRTALEVNQVSYRTHQFDCMLLPKSHQDKCANFFNQNN